jgi:hypothetical protein
MHMPVHWGVRHYYHRHNGEAAFWPDGQVFFLLDPKTSAAVAMQSAWVGHHGHGVLGAARMLTLILSPLPPGHAGRRRCRPPRCRWWPLRRERRKTAVRSLAAPPQLLSHWGGGGSGVVRRIDTRRRRRRSPPPSSGSSVFALVMALADQSIDVESRVRSEFSTSKL